MPELDQALSAMRAAWMAGGSAADHCPADWRAAIGRGEAGPVAEAALAALVAHATQTLYRPRAPALTLRPLLPPLSAPQPSAEARGRLRRLMAVKGDGAGPRAWVRLLAARGLAMHPADWLPGPRDDWAPGLYAPWLAWAASQTPAGAPVEALSLETYDDWSWAERRAGLAALRRVDPDAARAIILAKARSEPAERRLKLVEILGQGLGEADADGLAQLAQDRAESVRGLARRLLARLGRGDGAGQDGLAAELAAMVDLSTTGLIQRRRRLTLAPLKTQAQENRRRELLDLVALGDLAAALGVTDLALTEAAPTGHPAAILGFVELVAQTGAEPARRALLARIIENGEAPLGLAVALGPRAAPEERASALAAIMAREASPLFAISLAFAGDALGAAPARALAASPAYAALTDLTRAAVGDDPAARTQADPQLRSALTSLGLLLDAAAARAVIEAGLAAGLSAADPRLDPLYLNAALNPERPT